MSADVITMIKTDHQELDRLLEMMRKEPSSRPLVLPLAVAMLTAHSRAEEDHVYPALAEAGEREEAEHGVEEHHKAEQAGRTLLGKDPEGPDFEESLSEWVSAIQHHVEEEEGEMLPQLQRALGTDRLVELGKAFASRRAAELTGDRGQGGGRGQRGRGSHPGRAGQRGRGGGRPSARGGPGKTREELYAEARKAGIQGRSTMSKPELARALSRRQGRGR
jgi:hemerythrin superfamily protein